MASVRTGSVVTDIRGSVGQQTYSRNSAGLFVRDRVVPTDNNTAAQQACRAALAACAVAWSATLTESQRSTWRAYAQQHPRTDRWGNPNPCTGQTIFVRSAFTRKRLDATFPFPSAPPTPPLHPPGHVATHDASANTVAIALPPTNYSSPPNNLELFLYIGIEQAPGRSYFSSPYRYLGRNLFTGTWSSDPWILNYPDTLHTGQRLWSRLVAQMHDTGEISEPSHFNALVVA